MDIIDILKNEHPDACEYRKGFPNVGKRQDNKEFGDAVKRINEAWNYYDIELRKIPSNQGTLNLGSGDPLNFPPFPGAIKFLEKEMKGNIYQYGATAGEPKHCKMIADYLVREGFPEYVDSSNVIVTSSTTNGFYLILKSLFRPYDVILMTAPNYGLFAFMPERMNISVELLPLFEDDNYLINPNNLETRIIEINEILENKYGNSLGYVPCVRGFLNINPHNPLGTVMSKKNIELLESIGSICKKHNVLIIDDLVYRDLSYDTNNIAKPIGTIPEYFDNTISLFGLSKSFGLAQARAGFVVANDMVVRVLRDNIFYTMDSASVLQSSLLAGTYNVSNLRDQEYKKYIRNIIPYYVFNSYLCMALFNGIDSINNTPYYESVLELLSSTIENEKLLQIICEGVPCTNVIIHPSSGFFLLVDFSELKNYSDIECEKDLLEYLYIQAGVKFLVGQSISWPNKEQMIMRMTYSFEPKVLITVIAKINVAIRKKLYENVYSSKNMEYKLT